MANIIPTARSFSSQSAPLNCMEGRHMERIPSEASQDSVNDDVNTLDSTAPLIQKTKRNKIEDVGTNSTLWTFFVILKSYVGSGMIGLPYAFLQGGVWPGIGTIIAIALVTLYCIHLLMIVKARYQDVTDLPDLGMRIAGKWGSYLVQFTLLFTQIGFSTAYLIFIGTNLHDFFPSIPVAAFIAMVIPVFIGICLVRRLKYLGPPSLLAYIAIIFACCVVLENAISNHIVKDSPTWDDANRFPYKTLPIFFGIVVYIFEGIGLVIDMEKAMKQPEKFEKTQALAYIVLVISFISFGVVGYLAYRDDTESISLLNLPKHAALTQTTIIMVMISLYFSYPIQMFPVFGILENTFFTPQTPWLETKRNILRSALVCLTAGFAMTIPHFGLFISLIGSFGCSFLAFIMPSFFYLKVCWHEVSRAEIVGNVLILVFGLIASIISTTLTIIEIAEL